MLTRFGALSLAAKGEKKREERDSQKQHRNTQILQKIFFDRFGMF